MEQTFHFIEKEGFSVLERYQGTEPLLIVPADSGISPVAVIGRYAFAENRIVEEIQLPESIASIERHAFYNCRGLRKLSVPGSLQEIGDGALKNCENLEKIVVFQAQPGNICLKHLVYDQNHTFEADILYDQTDGQKEARLLFPSFEYGYVANEPARIFNEVGYGAGYLYQQCFFNRDVDYKRYDEVFLQACISEPLEILERIARLRLLFPYALSAGAERRYRTYLSEQLPVICVQHFQRDAMQEMDELDKLGFFAPNLTHSLIHVVNALREKELLSGVAWTLDKIGKKEVKKELFEL